MRRHWRSISIMALSASLAGCAPTVWSRPGSTLAEANLSLEECADVAARVTPASNTHIRGRQTAAAVIGAGLIDAISDGIRQGAARSDCMIGRGFTPQRASPAPVQIASATPSPSPSALDAPILLTASTVPMPTTLNPAPSTSAAPMSATSISAAPNHAEPIRLAPQSPPIDRRQVITQDLMRLPDRSRTKAAFLLGACSAGDTSACILSDLYNPKRSNLN